MRIGFEEISVVLVDLSGGGLSLRVPSRPILLYNAGFGFGAVPYPYYHLI